MQLLSFACSCNAANLSHQVHFQSSAHQMRFRTHGKKKKPHGSTSSARRLKVCLGPIGGAVPPRAAGGCGDAVGGGADEPGHGGGRPRRPVEAAVQHRDGTQQRGGRVRPEVSARCHGHTHSVRAHAQRCSHSVLSVLLNCGLLCKKKKSVKRKSTDSTP